LKRRKPFIWISAVVLGAATLLLLPWESPVAPQVRVQVLDETGRPASNVVVTQRWGHFNFGSEKETHARTNESGYVEFPPRSVRANLASRIIKPVVDVLTHEGLGPYAQIHAYGSDPYVWTSVASSVKDPLPTEVRLKRRDVALYP